MQKTQYKLPKKRVHPIPEYAKAIKQKEHRAGSSFHSRKSKDIFFLHTVFLLLHILV